MMSQAMAYLPSLLAGVVLLVVAWLLATLVKAVANKALKATLWDEKLVQQAGMSPLAENVGNVLFWLVILMFLPAVLGVFQLQGMLDPVSNMVDKILLMLPNIFAAVIIVFAGWLVAKILRALVTNLLMSVGANKLGDSAGLKGSVELPNLAGLLVFILVFVPALIAALDALKVSVISDPASEMLGMMMTAIPNIFVAALILFITGYVAKFAAALLGSLLTNIGLNNLPDKIGLENLFTKNFKASDLLVNIMIFFAMLFATVEAANRLEFTQVHDLVSMFIKFGGDVLLGVSILMVGFWLANLAHQSIMRVSQKDAVGVANIARYAIIGMVLAMGLSAMGIADNIVQIAFALIFGTVAVMLALSFGLGGREAAGKQMEYWLSKLRK